jgi:TctA family transporter
MLAGIYYGAQYGGSTTAILINIPGETSSVVTTIDGHQMARRGRAGPALGIAAIGSFAAGCIATLVIAYFAPLLAEVALKFGPAEYFSLMVFGLIAAVVLARGSLIKAIAMVCLGILLGLVGTDVNSGTVRFAFGQPELSDGIGFVAIAMAFFGIADVVINLERSDKQQIFTSRIGSVLPTLDDLRQSFWAILRGTGLGSVLGILPGGGALLASFAAYMVEKKVAKPPRMFGEGDIRGVAAPESANNAGAQTSFIPMLTLDPVRSHYGADDRRAHHPGHRARTAGDDRAARAVLGPHCQHVGGQSDAAHPQPADGRALDQAARRALPAAVSGDLRVLLHRRLHGRRQDLRRLRDRGVERAGLCVAQTRL